MNADLAQELLNELGSSLEALETEQKALLQFLKDNGTLTDDQFAPYLAQAGRASSVRWRAAHIRLDSLISTERQKEEEHAEKEKRQAGMGKAPIQNHELAAKAEIELDRAAGGPPDKEAKSDETADGVKAESISERENKQVETATREDKEPSPASKDS